MISKLGRACRVFLLITFVAALLVSGCSRQYDSANGTGGSFAGIREWEGSISILHTIEEEKVYSAEGSKETGLDQLVIAVILGKYDGTSEYLTWRGSGEECADWDTMSYTIFTWREQGGFESTLEVAGEGKSRGSLTLDIDEENGQYRIQFLADMLEVPWEHSHIYKDSGRSGTESGVSWHELGLYTNWHPLPESGLALVGGEEIVDITETKNITTVKQYTIEWEFRPQ